MRRLLGSEHRDTEFATSWREYDLDLKTRALLGYAEKLTTEPSFIEDPDIDALTRAGWDDRAIREMTRLIAFYNFTGRLEAASGLQKDVADDKGLDRFTGRIHSRAD